MTTASAANFAVKFLNGLVVSIIISGLLYPISYALSAINSEGDEIKIPFAGIFMMYGFILMCIVAGFTSENT